ncbi:MAG TPA: TIGR02679 family protein [Trebonia sp.]|nr:TIGR02679 family protein [Trebonia sp.]
MPNKDVGDAESTAITNGAAPHGHPVQGQIAPREVGGYAGSDYRRLLDAARKSLERTGGDLTRTVTVKTPDDKERRAIIGITGQYRPEGVSVLAVRLADLDRAIREASGHGLIELLEQLGPALRDRPAERQRLADGREASTRSVEKSFLSERDWFKAWLAELAADGTLTRLVNTGDAGQLRYAARVLEWVEQRIEIKAAPTQLAELAATITGDTKALSQGTALATLVLRALACRQGASRPRTTEERRDLWDQCGIVVDDLASRVLVLNLPAEGSGLGEWLTSASTHGTPFYVTLHQLVTMPLAVRPGVLVHACENPAVLRRAAGDLGPAAQPLICTEGQPSTAFHRLAAAITGADGALRYHGDFDWPGVGIAASIFGRHHATPWRFGALDYEAAIKADADQVPLAGSRRPTPWDPALEETMTAHGRAVYEESVAATLVGDLKP